MSKPQFIMFVVKSNTIIVYTRNHQYPADILYMYIYFIYRKSHKDYDLRKCDKMNIIHRN